MSALTDSIPLQDVRRALVVNLRHIGDVLLSTPVPNVLKRHAPHCEVDVLVYADTAAMMSLHPAISELHLIRREWKQSGMLAQAHAEWTLLQRLYARRYDLLIMLTPHRRGQWLARALRPRWTVAPPYAAAGKGWRKAFPYITQRPIATWRHTVEIYLDSLRLIGCQPTADERYLCLVPGTTAEARIDALLAEHGLKEGNFVHLHPGSRWKFKCWPAAANAALIDRLQAAGRQVVLTAAPDQTERTMVAEILRQARRPPIDLSARLDLKELAALCARAAFFVGVDSAPMHIAAAMGTPQIALFGPSGSREWGPWSGVARVLTNTDHQCVPCGRAGCSDSKRSECLEGLSVDNVFAAIELQIAAAERGECRPPEWAAHVQFPPVASR